MEVDVWVENRTWGYSDRRGGLRKFVCERDVQLQNVFREGTQINGREKVRLQLHVVVLLLQYLDGVLLFKVANIPLKLFVYH